MEMVLKLNFSCSGVAPRRSAAPSCLELSRFGRWVKIPPRRLPEKVFQMGGEPKGHTGRTTSSNCSGNPGFSLGECSRGHVAHTPNASTDMKTSHLWTLFCFPCQLSNKCHMPRSVNTLRQPQLQSSCDTMSDRDL